MDDSLSVNLIRMQKLRKIPYRPTPLNPLKDDASEKSNSGPTRLVRAYRRPRTRRRECSGSFNQHSRLAQLVIKSEGVSTIMATEERVLQLLIDIQSSADEPRRRAEAQLQEYYANPDLAPALCKIGTFSRVDPAIQQAALVFLKNYIVACWSPELEGFKGEDLIGPTTKGSVKEFVLETATSDRYDRKVQNTCAYIVSRIASVEYPDDWPELLPTLLETAARGNDKSLHGTLKILSEIVEDGLDEAQFFIIAPELVQLLHHISSDEQKNMLLRALAVSVFRGCFDMLEMIMEGHKQEIKLFAEGTVNTWMPFFMETLKSVLPQKAAEGGADDKSKGLTMLKLQVMKTLMRIRLLFPSIIAPQSLALFEATWEELLSLQRSYQTSFVENQQEGRLEDADGLPFTLDFLVLEDLDFLQACIRAPLVKRTLEQQLKAGQTNSSNQNWIVQVLGLAVPYAEITIEEEGIWHTDVNMFLSEETSVTANYTARTACGDLTIKIGEWLPDSTMQALLVYVMEVLASDLSWRMKEAALYILGQVLGDWQDLPRSIDESMFANLIEPVKYAMTQDDDFLRARGYLLAGMLAKGSKEAVHITAVPLLEATLQAISSDRSVVVQVSCIRAMGQFVSALQSKLTSPYQATIISTLFRWLNNQDLNDLTEGDDLMMTLIETLRDTLLIDMSTCVDGDGLNLLFSIATPGASNIQIAAQIIEVWEDVCLKFQAMGKEAYAQLCQKVLPSLTGAFNVGSLTEENALSNLAAELLSCLTEHAQNSLPSSFVPSVLPKILPILMASEDSDLLKYCTTSLRYILQNDAPTLLSYQDPSPAGSSPSAQKSGLECTLLIIERLLGPDVDDIAASEVGHLASALVSAASSTDQLTPYLPQLLQAVAQRLAFATQASLLQSLILVFARLSLTSAREVLDFLASINLSGQNGLQMVVPKWLENSGDFAGYDEIRTNTVALARMYELHDSRLDQVPCKGEIIVDRQNEARIMTRSRAKQQGPEKWTSVSANIKIIKVLIAELTAQLATSMSGFLPQKVLEENNRPSGNGVKSNGHGDGDSALGDYDDEDDDEESDGEWEDEPGTGVLDLGLGATKADLMAYGGEEGNFRVRQPDDETQAFLVEWFKMRAGEPAFAGEFSSLTEEERSKLSGLG